MKKLYTLIIIFASSFLYAADFSNILQDSTGIDYLDHTNEKTYFFHGARGDCGLGSTPANGQLYQFPNMCMCMGQVDGVSNVSSHSLTDPAESKLKLSDILEKGPASAWSLHGSLLVENGIIYAIAGHHNELDAGLILQLDPVTGEKKPLRNTMSTPLGRPIRRRQSTLPNNRREQITLPCSKTEPCRQ